MVERPVDPCWEEVRSGGGSVLARFCAGWPAPYPDPFKYTIQVLPDGRPFRSDARERWWEDLGDSQE